jgi:hypothetical protein
LKYLIRIKVFGQGNVDVYPTYKERYEISKNTLNFIDKHITPSTEYLSSNEELSKINSLVDGVIVGSDQVWRPNYTPNIYAYYLDFLRSDKLKISYAASLGTDKWLYTEHEKSICKKLLHEFDYISVREDSGVDLISDHFGLKADQLADPTLLLTKSDYLGLLSGSFERKEKTVFTYVLDDDEFTESIIKKVSEELGLIPFKVMPLKFDINYTKDKSKYVFPPVEKWISAFASCDYVVADSFHGCVFSIIFNKPFVAIGNMERGLTRFTSLLKTFNLQDRLILKGQQYDESIFQREIDWHTVNTIHKDLKVKASKYLMGAINGQ